MSTDDELAQVLWDYNRIEQPVAKADVIIAFCSNDLRVAHRATELYLAEYAPLLVFSGGVGRLTEGLWDKPEAEIFADEAIGRGVPEEKILIENKSTNTGENIIRVKQLLAERGLEIHSAILVQKPYMLRRIQAAFQKQWPEVRIMVTSPFLTYLEYPNEAISHDELINAIVGDTLRVKLYGELGYQVKQEVPSHVSQACEELIKRGFSKYVIS